MLITLCTAAVERADIVGFPEVWEDPSEFKDPPKFFVELLIIRCNSTIGSRPILEEETHNGSAQYLGGGLELKARISCHYWHLPKGFNLKDISNP